MQLPAREDLEDKELLSSTLLDEPSMPSVPLLESPPSSPFLAFDLTGNTWVGVHVAVIITTVTYTWGSSLCI